MAIRTRSATSSPAKAATLVQRSSSKVENAQFPATKIVIVPQSCSSDSRILRLRHPRDGCTVQFLFCPRAGLFEFTKVMVEATDPRSILFSLPDMANNEGGAASKTQNRTSAGYISEDAEIVTTTPFDLVFMLLSKLASSTTSSKKAVFQPLDDLLDIPESEDNHFRYVLEHAAQIVERAMSSICDVVEAGGEKLYRYSEDKVLHLWLGRAKQVVERGLPASLEERFVTRALEVPVLSVKREESASEISLSGSGLEDSVTESIDSQSTVLSTTASAVFSEVSEMSSITTVPEDLPVTNVRRLLQLRVALNFISASCLPDQLNRRLQQKLTMQDTPISFKALDEELLRIASLKADALASRSFTDFSRKRTGADDDEAAEIRAEKRRKLEEEERKRKANESRGVRDLKKVNVSGMKKMSDFFSKKPATAKIKS